MGERLQENSLSLFVPNGRVADLVSEENARSRARAYRDFGRRPGQTRTS